MYCQTDVAEEGETGKVYRADFFDKRGRSVLVLVPANQVLRIVGCLNIDDLCDYQA